MPSRRPEKLISVVELEVEGPSEVDESLSIDPVYRTSNPVAFAKATSCQITE